MEGDVLGGDTLLVECPDHGEQRLRPVDRREPEGPLVLVVGRAVTGHGVEEHEGPGLVLVGHPDFDHRPADLVFQLVPSSLGDHVAPVDDGDAVGELVGFIEVLGGQQHGRSGVDEVPDQTPKVDAALRVNPGGGLVEEEDLGPADQRGGQVEPPSHTARVCANGAVGSLTEVDTVEDLGSAPSRLGSGEVVEPADHLHVLPAGEVVVDGCVLPRQPDVGPDGGGVGGHIYAGNFGVARVGAEECGEHADESCLAGAVGAQQPVHDARLEFQTHPVQGAYRVAEGFDDLFDPNDGFLHLVPLRLAPSPADEDRPLEEGPGPAEYASRSLALARTL